MVFAIILLSCYAALRLLFALASLFDPTFRSLLTEADLAFVVRSNASPSSYLFQLRGGKLRYRPGAGGEGKGASPFAAQRDRELPRHPSFARTTDFTITWNGWGHVDTWGQRLRLHPVEFLSTGMVTLEGDLSRVVTLFMLLGEALGCFTRKKPAPVRRAEPGKETA